MTSCIATTMVIGDDRDDVDNTDDVDSDGDGLTAEAIAIMMVRD